MKAILVREHGGPEVLKLEELPDPKPGADQVVVRLKAVGVNPVDVYIRTGAYARKPALPFVPIPASVSPRCSGWSVCFASAR